MQLYLTESRFLRISSFAIFYLAQGLPIGLISIALPAWLAEQGASAADIAYFVAISGLPWGFKLLAGPVMDRFSLLAMGRRRPWVIASQGGLLIAICLLGTTHDPVENIVLLTWFAFVVNMFAAVQDVAVDGMAIDVLPEDERGRANAFMAFGQVAGYSGSAAICAIALVRFGLAGAAIVLASGVFGIFVWGVIVRERQGEKLLPWTEGVATDRSVALQATDWTSILVNLLRVIVMPASSLLILMALFWRIQSGFWVTATPIVVVNQLGFSSTDYSSWIATAGFIAAVLGLVFGPMIDRSGSRKLLLSALIGLGALHTGAGLLVDLWTESWFLLVILFADQFLTQIIFICFIALHMNICWERIAATQFAIYMAWSNLARSIGAGIYGELQPHLAMGQEFIVMGISCFLAAAMLSVVNIERHGQRLDELREDMEPQGDMSRTT
ncbi:MAG: MFS transporter [Gammaproteobacteria bacterium]|jgi:MFS transporter, PAT family, beta-lactamase induction signal transducer AmpG|nr:MFS transporter [Gammaproteobacteria bacterium]MBT7371768.1 MFS transporter [Gammaproteobacteria bacterium]